MLNHTDDIAETSLPAASDAETTPATLQGSELQAFLRRKVRRQGARLTNYTVGILAAILLMPCVLFLALSNILPIFIMAPVFFLPFLLLAGGIMRVSAKNQQAENDIAEMVQAGGIEAIGPLLEMLTMTRFPTDIHPIYQALTTLLPQMKADDSHLLNANHRRILNARLFPNVYRGMDDRTVEDFSFAAVCALRQIGDKSSLPAVRKLAGMRTATPGRKRIKQAAIECLPALMQNMSGVQQSQTLLRAADAPAPDPATLLRPASGTGTTDSEHLLRAVPGADREPPPAT